MRSLSKLDWRALPYTVPQIIGLDKTDIQFLAVGAAEREKKLNCQKYATFEASFFLHFHGQNSNLFWVKICYRHILKHKGPNSMVSDTISRRTLHWPT